MYQNMFFCSVQIQGMEILVTAAVGPNTTKKDISASFAMRQAWQNCSRWIYDELEYNIDHVECGV